MKKRYTSGVALAMSTVLGLSLIACGDNGRDGGGDPTMTREKWVAAFEKADALSNRTFTTSVDMAMKLTYNGEEVTETTDIGGIPGSTLLTMMGSQLGEHSLVEQYFIDAENGKVNYFSYEGDEVDAFRFYRLKGTKVEYTRVYPADKDDPDDETQVYKEIYGPYADAATIKNMLKQVTGYMENLSYYQFTYKNGDVVDFINDYNKFTYANGAYSADLCMSMHGLDFEGKGTMTMTDDYISSVKYVATCSMDMSESGLPEGLLLESALTAELKLTAVGTTAVSDTDLVEPDDENDIQEYSVISTEAQFAALFPDLNDGVRFSFYGDDEYTNYSVEIKKTETGYNAYVMEREYNDDWEIIAQKAYYYVVSASGIQKYEGEFSDESLAGWKAPTNASSTGTLDALLALLPAKASNYFATYNDGKTIAELYSEFKYVDTMSLAATLTSGSKTVKVNISFYHNGSSFSLNRFELGDAYFYGVMEAYEIDDYNPDTFVQEQD